MLSTYMLGSLKCDERSFDERVAIADKAFVAGHHLLVALAARLLPDAKALFVTSMS